MKTKFEISHIVFMQDEVIENCYKYYEKYYKKNGFILDKENEEVYIMFGEQFNFNEGDSLELYDELMIVKWKSTNINDRVITYYLIEE